MKTYNSETGDIIDPSDAQLPGVPPVEPLRIPGIVDNFLATFIPAQDSRTATDWIGIAELRTMLAAYPPFGAKEDPLQEVLDTLSEYGFLMRDVGLDVPYILAIRKDSPAVLTIYDNEDTIL